jgi:flavin-dependent dehydrogenase
MSPEQLSAAAGLLVSELVQRGCSASLASGAQAADVIVAAMDELHEGSDRNYSNYAVYWPARTAAALQAPQNDAWIQEGVRRQWRRAV